MDDRLHMEPPWIADPEGAKSDKDVATAYPLQLYVEAGGRQEHAHRLHAGEKMAWRIAEQASHHVDFVVLFRPDRVEAGDLAVHVVLPQARVASHAASYIAPVPGKLSLYVGNEFSWYAITYRATVVRALPHSICMMLFGRRGAGSRTNWS
jgi:hypothetical protein